MILCLIRYENLIKFRRKRYTMTAADITAMLNDPSFRAMVEFRKKVRTVSENMRKNSEDN